VKKGEKMLQVENEMLQVENESEITTSFKKRLEIHMARNELLQKHT